MNMNEKLDYSNLNAVELKAIAMSYRNMLENKGETFQSSLPYLSGAIEVLAEELADCPAMNIDELKILHDELLMVNKHLLQMAPKPPSSNPEEIVATLIVLYVFVGYMKFLFEKEN